MQYLRVKNLSRPHKFQQLLNHGVDPYLFQHLQRNNMAHQLYRQIMPVYHGNYFASYRINEAYD
ncbi:unnamed protein product [Schistosoma curassoni]|uniref:KTSC domain-containing protein n=1 Tax=Schistosoma curassoni TaxID=6186 RepID=A0A183L193_9TREM|nr:unnamed protein product [Schistosoma curassoni]